MCWNINTCIDCQWGNKGSSQLHHNSRLSPDSNWWIVIVFSIDPNWPFCIVFVHRLAKCWADFTTKVTAEIARQTDLKSTFLTSINSTEFLSIWIIWWPPLRLHPLNGCGATCTTLCIASTVHTTFALPHIHTCWFVMQKAQLCMLHTYRKDLK